MSYKTNTSVVTSIAATSVTSSLTSAIGTTVQAHDVALDAVSNLAMAPSTFLGSDGATLVLRDAASSRSSLGLSSAATTQTTTVSAGAADVGKIPLLDATGKLDASAVPSAGGGADTSIASDVLLHTVLGDVTLTVANHVVIINKPFDELTNVTLPTAGVPLGKMFTIKDGRGTTGNSTAFRIEIDPGAGKTIDGFVTRSVNRNYGSMTIMWDGINNWYAIAKDTA